jgi:hypothetical protein
MIALIDNIRIYQKLLGFIIIIGTITFNSCEKDIKTYYLTDEEKGLVMLYNESDTFKLKNNDNKIYSFYINRIDSGIAENDFLGVPQYEYEYLSIDFKLIDRYDKSSIYSAKPENVFRYLIKFKFPDNYFEIDYDSEKKRYKLQNVEQLEINGISYQDVYIFNNATSETAQPTQKIYLNTEHGFLKLEDLEKDVVYTIVRE